MAVSTITITSGASTLIPTVEPVVLTLGTVGPQGVAGVGVPAGGTVNQILAKTGAANYATGWIDNYTTDVRIIAKNDSGTTLAKGTVVYVSGANGTNVLIKPAIATSDTTSATTVGLTLQQMIPNNTNWVITQGTLSGIDTSAGAAGDPVWLSGTVAGGLVFGFANEPQAPTHLVYLGTVTRAHATQGSIEVKINNGWELNELHNVKITSPTNGQVLTYDSANSLWINSSETGDISSVAVTSPITGGGTSGAVTIGIQDGTTAQKGAVQLTDSVASTSTTTAATANAVKTAYDQANLKVSSVTGTAPITSSGGTTPAIGISAATTSAAGAVQLTDSTSSTSTTTAATPNSVKTAYDLASAATPKTTTLTAGTGLTGGGTLAANRTFTVDNTVIDYAATSSLRSLPLYSQKAAAEKLLAQAVWWIDAAHSSASGQTITNLGWGGSALNATAGSTGSADSNDPKFLDWTGTNHVYVPVATNNSVITGSITAFNNDLDIRANIAMDDWTPAVDQRIFGNNQGDPNRWVNLVIATTGNVKLQWYPTGSNASFKEAVSTVAPTVTDGSALWIRATLDVDNGASGYTVTFYTSSDGSSWTQLGSTVTAAGITNLNASVGAFGIGASGAVDGIKYYNLRVIQGINGTDWLNIDTSVITSGAATSFTALTGQTVTINRATSGRKTCVVTNPVWLFGTDDVMTAPDNDLLDFSATESMTAIAIIRQWGTPTSFGRYLTKRNAGAGWYLATNGTTAQPRLFISDGTNTASQNGTTITAGTLNLFGGEVDRASNLIYTVNGSTLSAGVSSATVGTLANAEKLSAGADPNPANFQDFEGYAFLVFRRILTTAELALINNYYTTRVA